MIDSGSHLFLDGLGQLYPAYGRLSFAVWPSQLLWVLLDRLAGGGLSMYKVCQVELMSASIQRYQMPGLMLLFVCNSSDTNVYEDSYKIVKLCR